MKPIDDDPHDPRRPIDGIEALLRRPLPELPDDGFSAAVMARVRALPTPAPAAPALAWLQGRYAMAQRAARWERGGALVGAAVALAWWAASDGAVVDLAAQGATLSLALLVSAAAVAWSLLSAPN